MPLPTFTILDRLRKAREHVSLTQAAFAEKVGVSTVTYSRYESGARSVPDEVIERVTEATNIPLEWFYQDESAQLPATPTGNLPTSLTVRWTPGGIEVTK